MSEDEIAIVGVGCRFPGADNVDEYWKMLVNGENHVQEIPKERWKADAFYDPDPNKPGKTYARKAGFLKRFDEWDHRFFGVSEMEAALMDPQQRIVLECVHMAMEDGDITRQQIDGTHTGVYIGVMNNDYKGYVTEDQNLNSTYMVTVTSVSIISARVSYVYNLLGPALTIDTACSSSLVAINIGSQALNLGDCDAAICGGVNLLMDPGVFVALSKARMLSPTGQCQAFSAGADGYARGEGCGIVILKRLKDAIRDGNKIWATVKTACNQDGHFATPITAPSETQQIDLLERVYRLSGVDRDTIQVIEAHGTGTAVGDPVEANALGKFFSHNTTNKRTIYIGSVKTNIGHLESAAGVAGLIKVLLMMKHVTIVPSLLYTEENENPKVKLKQYGFIVPTKCTLWNVSQKIRTACVNSFGFGGTNAHAIVHQFTQMRSDKREDEIASPYFITLSAPDHDSLKQNINQFLQDVEVSTIDLPSLSYTSTCKRNHLTERKAFLVDTKDHLMNCCREFLGSQPVSHKTSSQKKLVFVCCGVGTVWNGMFSSLLDNIAFSEALRKIDHILTPLAGWSIKAKASNWKEDLLTDPLVSHIAIFAYQVGLSALWRSIGIFPDCVIGQSVGEVAAAYIAGKIDLSSAVKIIYYRSSALSQVTVGGMAVTSNIPTDEVEEICKLLKGAVAIAVYNSPMSCTVSGDKDAIKAMMTQFESRGEGKVKSKVKELNVKCAYHSKYVEPVVSSLIARLDKIKSMPSDTEIVSTVTGQFEDGTCFGTSKYWGNNVRNPVYFNQGIKNSAALTGTTIFIEIGPSPVLQAHAHQILGEKDFDVLPSCKIGNSAQTVKQSICKLYEYGFNIQWHSIVARTNSTTVMPKYRFVRKQNLYQTPAAKLRNQGVNAETKSHLYVERMDDLSSGPQFSARINKNQTPFVYEHMVRGQILVPGAFHADIGFEVGKVGLDLPSQSAMIVSVQFLKPIRIEKFGEQIFNITCEKRDDECTFSVKQGNTTMCKGLVIKRTELSVKMNTADELHYLKHLMASGRTLSETEIYMKLKSSGFEYGNSFRVLKHCTVIFGACLVEMEIPAEIINDLERTVIHPCVLDGLFQSAVTIMEESFPPKVHKEDLVFMPVGVETISAIRQPVQNMLIYTKRTNYTVLDTVLKIHFNSTLYDTEGHVVASVNNFTVYSKRTSNSTPDELRYCITWKPLKMMRQSKQKRLLLLAHASDGPVLKDIQSKHTVICCRDSFIEDYQDYLSNAFGECEAKWGSMNETDCIVIVFEKTHIEDFAVGENAQQTYQNALHNCWFLVTLLRYLVSEEIRKPVFLVTQNTHIVDNTKENVYINLAGAEVWGFFRSLQMEFLLDKMTIVDVSPGLHETKRTLLNYIFEAVNNTDQTETEIKINNTDTYKAVFSACSSTIQTPAVRRVEHKEGYEYSVRSENPRCISGPHLFACNKDSEHSSVLARKKNILLRIQTVFVHSPNIFPVIATPSNEVNDQQSDAQQGYPVWGVEYTGYLKDTNKHKLFQCGRELIQTVNDFNENKWKYIAVFPTEMSSVVSVPAECAVNMKYIPFYEEGLLFRSILSWAISENIPMRSTVVLLHVDSADRSLKDVLKTMLVKRRNAVMLPAGTEKADVYITLSPEVYQTRALQKAKCVICLKNSIPANIHKRLVIKDRVIIKEIDVTDIFSQQYISRVLRKVVPWLRENHRHFLKDKSKETEIKKYVIETSSLPCMVPMTRVFDKASTYVITGGLTGLGWELLLLLAEMGAGTIATLGRRNLSEERTADIKRIEQKYSCNILCLQADVNRLDTVINAMKAIQSHTEAGPIRGVIHGAGTLDPSLLIKITKENLDHVMRPKVLGILNMHIATKHLRLDFFIMQSSITSIIGQPAQINYAAANSFLDTFAHWRRVKGLPAQAINWGALSVGMSAEAEFTINFEKRGYYLLTVQEIRSCFQQCVMQDCTGTVYSNIDWHLLGKDYSKPQMYRNRMKMNDVLDEKGVAAFSQDYPGFILDVERLREFDVDRQKETLNRFVQAVVSRLLDIDITSFTMQTTFAEMGLDSVSSVTFSNVVYDMTRCRIDPHFMLDPDRTLNDVVNYVSEKLFSSDSEIKSL